MVIVIIIEYVCSLLVYDIILKIKEVCYDIWTLLREF